MKVFFIPGAVPRGSPGACVRLSLSTHLQNRKHGVRILQPGAAGGGALRERRGQWLPLLHHPRAQPVPQQLGQRVHCRAAAESIVPLQHTLSVASHEARQDGKASSKRVISKVHTAALLS